MKHSFFPRSHFTSRKCNDPLSAVISGGTDILGGFINNIFNRSNMAKQNEYNMDMQHDAQEFAKEMWNAQNVYNDPKAVRERMKNAGLNPMMMNEQGGNSASLPSSPVGSGVGLPSTNGIGNPLLTAAQIDNIKADTKQKLSNANNTDIQTAILEGSKTGIIDYNNIQVDIGKSQIDLNTAEVKQLEKNIEMLDHTIAQVDSDIELKYSQLRLNAQEIQHLRTIDTQEWDKIFLQADSLKHQYAQWDTENRIAFRSLVIGAIEAQTNRMNAVTNQGYMQNDRARVGNETRMTNSNIKLNGVNMRVQWRNMEESQSRIFINRSYNTNLQKQNHWYDVNQTFQSFNMLMSGVHNGVEAYVDYRSMGVPKSVKNVTNNNSTTNFVQGNMNNGRTHIRK